MRKTPQGEKPKAPVVAKKGAEKKARGMTRRPSQAAEARLRERERITAQRELAKSQEFRQAMKKYTPKLPPRKKREEWDEGEDGEKPVWKKIQEKKERKEEANAERAETQAAIEAAAAEILHDEEGPGFIRADEGEGEDDGATRRLSQRDIASAVDVASSAKAFDLRLDERNGPYRIDFTRGGRHLLLSGRHGRGHLAVVDLLRKRVVSEFEAGQPVNDSVFLINETSIAAAQKRWLHIYDGGGTELHCLRTFRLPLALEFLPYHLLLCAATESARIHFLDVSTGAIVAQHRTHMGPTAVIAQNPANAIMCTGHNRGVVTMWSPNVGTPLVKSMMCHRGPVNALAIDTAGTIMVTAGADSTVKIWDVRSLKPMSSFTLKVPARSLSVSQRGLLAIGAAAHVEIWQRDPATVFSRTPFLTHVIPGAKVEEIRFCPFEDVLGIGHSLGFTSMIVPGAGEPNYDSLEANPFENKKQRRESEVVRLLEKIPASMISLGLSGGVGAVATEAEVEHEKKRELEKDANRDGEDVAGEGAPDVEKKMEKKLRKRKRQRAKGKKRKVIIFEEDDAKKKEERAPLRPKKEVVHKIRSALDLFTKKVKF